MEKQDIPNSPLKASEDYSQPTNLALSTYASKKLSLNLPISKLPTIVDK